MAATWLSRDDQARRYREQMGETALERQKRQAATKCKSCFAPIIWAVTTGGKRMPLDYDENEAGNVFYYERTGRCDVKTQQTPTPPGATRHFSHFATCPNASDHRRS
jgi:hypothetical protein